MIVFLKLFYASLAIAGAAILLLPFPVLGWELGFSFWFQRWYLPLLLAFTLGFSGAVLRRQLRWASFVQAQDWEGLKRVLWDRLLSRRSYGSQELTMHVLSCFLTDSPQEIDRLEDEYRKRHPRSLARQTLLFIMPLWYRQDFQGVERRLSEVPVRSLPRAHRGWYHWFLGAAAWNQGRVGLVPLRLASATGGICSLFAAFVLDRSGDTSELPQRLRERWRKVSAARRRKLFDREKERVLPLLLLEGVYRQCERWLLRTIDVSQQPSDRQFH